MLEKDELKKLLKEKKIKSLDDFNAFMRDISKDVLETLFDGEMSEFLGYEKYDQKAKRRTTPGTGIRRNRLNRSLGRLILKYHETGRVILNLQ